LERNKVIMQDNDLRVAVLLTMQVALLGAIGPHVREVLCRWNASEIRIRAVFDGPIPEDDAEAMSVVETEMMASFTGHDISLVCERCDTSQPVLRYNDEHTVFARLETFA
jgi:hypothetical protein